jgi:hypothetical protein
MVKLQLTSYVVDLLSCFVYVDDDEAKLQLTSVHAEHLACFERNCEEQLENYLEVATHSFISGPRVFLQLQGAIIYRLCVFLQRPQM